MIYTVEKPLLVDAVEYRKGTQLTRDYLLGAGISDEQIERLVELGNLSSARKSAALGPEKPKKEAKSEPA